MKLLFLAIGFLFIGMQLDQKGLNSTNKVYADDCENNGCIDFECIVNPGDMYAIPPVPPSIDCIYVCWYIECLSCDIVGVGNSACSTGMCSCLLEN